MQVRGDAVRRSLTAVVAVVAASLLLASYPFPTAAEADHQPADKMVASGNTIDEVSDAAPVLVEYTTATMGRADADAFVGKRTLVVEPTKASIHEGT